MTSEEILGAEKKRLIRSAVLRFMLWVVVIGLLFSGFFLLARKYEAGVYQDSLRVHQQENIAQQKAVISKLFVSVEADLLFLAVQNELIRFLDTGDTSQFEAMQREYAALGRRKDVYEQIRYIDELGMERVRVNVSDGQAVPVAEDRLQSKASRYYFKDAFALNRDEIFISPLDLNIEHGRIEVPYKPMLRFATPVFDSSGRKRGVVIINLLAAAFLHEIKTFDPEHEFGTMLLNGDGYWLVAPDAELEWGFMLQERSSRNFSMMHPDAWKKMQDLPRGHFRFDDGVYAFEGVSLVSDCRHVSDRAAAGPVTISEKVWYLVSMIPARILHAHDRTVVEKYMVLGGVIMVVMGCVIWLLSWAVVKREFFQQRLLQMALRDPLTKLANRRALAEELSRAMEHAVRFDRRLAVLYIDLDGFKAVNDAYGHEAGDELLVEISHRFTQGTRQSDLCSRLGGDEFVCMLREIQSEESAMHAAEHILEAIRQPVKLSSGYVAVGASIGVAVFPEHGHKLGLLLNSADKAMFRAKQSGKNQCQLAEARRPSAQPQVRPENAPA